MDTTASRPTEYFDPATDYLDQSLPQPTATVRIKAEGHTMDAPSLPVPNRRAGERELAWFEAHRDELDNYTRKWIAITGQQVRVAHDTFADVRAFLNQEGIPDALIVYVRENAGREYFMD